MLCQVCKKHPATVHLTEIIEGEKREIHLCEVCAHKQGMSPFTPSSFLSQLVEPKPSKEGEAADVTCPGCGLTYSGFRQGGRLGCSECYKVFEEGLGQLLERIHGGTQHIGRVPKRAGSSLAREREIIDLKRELSRVIQREEYERAAEIRDRLRELEAGSGED